jgi:hypothetical protein
MDDPNSQLNKAREYNTSVMSGDYLQNPNSERMFNQGADLIRQQYNRGVQPGIATAFVGGGRGGSYAHQRADTAAKGQLGEQLGNLWERIGAKDYEKERGYQDTAAARAPGLDAAGYANEERLRGIGGRQDMYQQRLIDEAIRRFDFGQQEPWQRLGQYSGMVGAPVMTSSASSSGYNFNVCWVSAEYFGFFTPSWWAARNWIVEGWNTPIGRLFRAVYIRYGERLAGIVRRHHIVKAALRPLFGWLRRKGAEMQMAEARGV